MINFLLDDGAVQVVGAKTQRDLRDAGREHHPVGLDVIEIVEQQARNRDGLEIVVAGWRRQVRKPGVRRVKRQRNECSEAVRFVLQSAQGE